MGGGGRRGGIYGTRATWDGMLGLVRRIGEMVGVLERYWDVVWGCRVR